MFRVKFGDCFGAPWQEPSSLFVGFLSRRRVGRDGLARNRALSARVASRLRRELANATAPLSRALAAQPLEREALSRRFSASANVGAVAWRRWLRRPSRLQNSIRGALAICRQECFASRFNAGGNGTLPPASLAQLGEHALRTRTVVGSIPTGGLYVARGFASSMR